MDALSVNALSASYDKRHSVLTDVSVSVSAGTFLGLVGINGAGKTTLIKSILGLCNGVTGDVRLFNIPSTHAEARNHVSYLPEKFSPPPYCTCADFLKLSQRLYNQPYVESEVENMTQRLNLKSGVLSTSVRKLSKGMTQKIGLAATFLSNKRFLILDEPMSGLDPVARHHVKQLLREKKDGGTTILMSSHALADVDALSDRMLVIHNGRVAFNDSMSAFREQFRQSDLDAAFMSLVGTNDSELTP